MKIANSGVDFVSPPQDYAELFRIYRDYMIALIRRAGIDPQQAEDVASDILLRFMERDSLNDFDPTMSFEFDGKTRPARFKSYLSKCVITYARGHRDRLQRLANREPLIIDRPRADDDDSSVLDDDQATVPGPEDIVLAAMGEQVLIAQIRAYLSTIPRRSRFDACDLVALFDAVVEQVHRTGTCNAAELRLRFQVSPTAMHTWLNWLRTNIALFLKRPALTPRPRAARSPR